MEKIVSSIKLNHDDLVNFLSTATYGDNVFYVYIDNINNELYKSLENKTGDCYEDKLADCLLNGGYILVSNNEECYDIADEALKDDTSTTNKVYSALKQNNFFGEIIYTPIYQITLPIIEKALCEIASNKTKGKYSNNLVNNFYDLFEDESGDFYDAWNILQYIVFGDVIYG